MEFKNVSIIIPVIRETDLFEQVITRILSSTNHSDICEFIIVTHRELTAKESFKSIDKMRSYCEQFNIAYHLLYQNLPGMGGAMRDGLDVCKGSHTVIACADMSTEPEIIGKFVEYAKKYPEDITAASRRLQKKLIKEGYDKFKYIWNTVANMWLRVWYLSNLTDSTVGIRIAPTAYYRAVQWEELRHPFGLECTLKFLRLGIKFREIPMVQVGGTQSGYWDTLCYLRPALKIRFMSRKKILKFDTDILRER